MKKLDKVELERNKLAKLLRVTIRTNYSLEADAAINEKLPLALKKFDLEVQKGKMPDAAKLALAAV